MTIGYMAILEAGNLARAGAHPAMRLGEIIEALEGADDDLDVRFDFEFMTPTGVSSYRGYYSDLAIEFIGVGYGPASGANSLWMKCRDFRDLLKGAVGRSFEGWKGGWNRMTEQTPVWVANPGNSGGTAVIKVEIDQFNVTLHTAKID